MTIKRLVAKKIETQKDEVFKYKKGYSYIILTDPETGVYYEPKEGWEVTGENLEDLFNVVLSEEENKFAEEITGD